MERAFRDVVEFHVKGVGRLSVGPPRDLPTDEAVDLRIRLIDEECNELVGAIRAGDLPEIADGCADLIYVAIGAAIAHGIDLVPVWNAIQKANMAKFGPGSWKDEDGKVRKPPTWQHPDIKAILEAQIPLNEIYGDSWMNRGDGYEYRVVARSPRYTHDVEVPYDAGSFGHAAIERAIILDNFKEDSSSTVRIQRRFVGSWEDVEDVEMTPMESSNAGAEPKAG